MRHIWAKITRRSVAVAATLAGLAAFPVCAQTFQERLTLCLTCHGEKGQSEKPEVPSLGAQPAFYLLIQLYMFRERQRVVEVMNDATKGLTDEELRKLADTVSKLPQPQPVEGPVDNARMEGARVLIEQHRCNFCHQNLAGQENVPRLAGQREDYLVKTLHEYKTNIRRGYDASMAEVIYPLNDAQILDLAYFIAHAR